MFDKLKLRIKALEEVWAELTNKVDELNTKLQSEEYQAYVSQYKANKELAAKEGYFYLSSKADTILLEKLIQEVNKDPDLAVMIRTSDGATLTLRSYPVVNDKISNALNMFNKGE